MLHTHAQAETDETGFKKHETRLERLRREHRIPPRRLIAAYLYDVRMLVWEAMIPLVGFATVMVCGTLYLVISQGFDFWRALYETMSMLLLEQNVDFPADAFGRFLFFAIPTFGLAFVFQGVLDFGRLLLDKGSRIEAWQVALARTAQDHIIVCGLGRVSYRVMLQLLEARYEVVVIEQDWHSEFVPQALALRVPVIRGDASDPLMLEQAGIFQARGLVTAISNDLANIEIGLTARRMRPRLQVVLRIFNDRLDHNLEKSKFGLNSAFSSSALAAPTLAAAAVCRGIKYAVPLHNRLLGISEITVTPGGRLDNLVYKIEQEFHVQIIGYTGKTTAGHICWRHQVNPATRLFGGDRVLLLGSLHDLGEVWQHGHVRNKIMTTLGIELPQRPTPQHHAIIVCGLGRVGFRVVQALYQMHPRPEIVVVCEVATTTPQFLKEVQELGIPVIDGDARTEEALLEAGLQRAYTVAAATSDPLTNLRIGLAARQRRADIHLVLRVFSDVLADQLEDMFGIHTTFSTSALAAPTLAAAAVLPGTAYAIDIGDRLVSTVRLRVEAGDEFAGQTVAALREQQSIVVVALQRGGEFCLLSHDPDQHDRPFERPLKAGDEIVVLADIHTIALLRQRGARTDVAGARITRRLPPLSEALAGSLAGGNGGGAGHSSGPAAAATPAAPRQATETQELLERLLHNAFADRATSAAPASDRPRIPRKEQP